MTLSGGRGGGVPGAKASAAGWGPTGVGGPQRTGSATAQPAGGVASGPAVALGTPAVERPALHEAERHSHSRESIPAVDEVDAANGRRAQVFHVGHRALRWVFPRARAFSRERLAGLLAAVGDDAGPLGKVARLKGVLRTSEDEWLLAQVSGHGFDLRPSSWRRDSRVEVLLDDPAGVIDARAWDAAWLRVQQR